MSGPFTVWIMFTDDGWYPIQPGPQCKPEDHGRLNGHVTRIEDMRGNVLWSRAPIQPHTAAPEGGEA